MGVKMKSDTPRTDAMVTGNSEPTQDEYEDLAFFARQLERELALWHIEHKQFREMQERVKRAFQSKLHRHSIGLQMGFDPSDPGNAE